MDRRNATGRYGQTVYLPKLKGSRAVPLRRRRLEARSGVDGYDENWLQRLLLSERYGDDYESAHLADPDAVAQSYWWAHKQPKAAWSNEMEIRPHTESWTW